MRYVIEYIDYRREPAKSLPLRLRVMTPSTLPRIGCGRPTRLARRFPTETICHILHDSVYVPQFAKSAKVNILRVNGHEIPAAICYCRADRDYAGMCVGFIVRPDVNSSDFELREVTA
jgi:hypothetical protein